MGRLRRQLRRLGRHRPVVASLSFDADEFESRLCWVMGSPRSGSTWLYRMIAATGEVAGIDEPYLGHHLAPFQFEQHEDGSPQIAVLNDWFARFDSYFLSDTYEYAWQPAMRTAVLARFYTEVHRLAEDGGLERPPVVIKEPNGSHAADRIMSLLPGARLLFLLRDGRDVVDSQLDAARRSRWMVEFHGDRTLPDSERLPFVRKQSALWLAQTESVQRAFSSLPEGRRLLLRYEELLGDAERQLGRVLGWLGLDASPGRVAEIVSEYAFAAIPPGDRGSGSHARAASPGLWRENMSAEEREAMDAIMGPKLAELGYADASNE